MNQNLSFTNTDSLLIQEAFRPKQEWVNMQLRPCITDFMNRKDYPFLDDSIKQFAKRCQQLIDSS